MPRILFEDLELLRDVHRGLVDVEAGRIVSHEEARARLMARYSSTIAAVRRHRQKLLPQGEP